MSQLKKALEGFGLTLSDLPYEPASRSFEPVIQQLLNGVLTVGYLLDDNTSSNPLSDGSGFGYTGEIVTKMNNLDANVFNQAFALDSYGQPCSDYIIEEVPSDVVKKKWFDLALVSPDFFVAAQERWLSEVGVPAPDFFKPYLMMMANKEWREAAEFNQDVFDALGHYDFTYDLLCEISRDLVERNKIGAKYAIPLNISSCDGTASICDDYIEADGVWLPNGTIECDIERRGEVLAFGTIEEDFNSQTFKVLLAPCFGDIECPSFADEVTAYLWLRDEIQLRKLRLPCDASEEMLSRGYNQAALWLAEEAIDLYNKWVVGDVYSICYAFYEKNGDEWEMVADDLCGGYFGIENALQCIKDEFPI